MKTRPAEQQKRDLTRLAAKRESEIDASDIPPLSDDFFRSAVRNPYFKPLKTSTTVRIDADVLAWLKSRGRGYQTRINAILRAQMVREINGPGKADATPA